MRMKKKDVKSLSKNWIVKNVLLAVLFVVVLVALVSVGLNLGTQHNREIEVPDFTNLTFREASAVASAAGVRVIIEDSVYVNRLKPGAVYMQTPDAGSFVKRGRRIRLTTNTMRVKEVYMPSLVGYSLRQARAELLRSGLSLGKISYVRDIATNNVLRQQVRGVDVAPGKKLRSGTKVNLVLGLNPNESMTFVPKLVGRQYLKAVDMLQDNSLNVGRLRFDESVKTYADSLNAVVYSQSPSSSQDAVRMGTEVSISLSINPDKIKK